MTVNTAVSACSSLLSRFHSPPVPYPLEAVLLVVGPGDTDACSPNNLKDSGRQLDSLRSTCGLERWLSG